MNRIKRDLFVAVLCFGTLLAGCAYFSPSAKQTRAEIKVEKTKDAIFTSEDQILKESKGYIYGADYALLLNPDTNKYTAAAKQMTTRAITALGPPDMVDVLKMQAIIEGLVSTNKATIEKAKSMLEEKDSEIVTLQSKISDYKEILKDKEQKFIEVSRENSRLADAWKKIIGSFKFIVWIFVIGFILNILSQVLPPPWNTVGSIVSIPFAIIIKLIRSIIPAASKYAGVVSEKIHSESVNTSQSLILAIEELKNKDRESYEKLKPILQDKTDINTRSNILSIKKDNNLI